MKRGWLPLLLAAVVACVGCEHEHEHSHGDEVPEAYRGASNPFDVADATAVDAGAALYATNCLGCHGEGLRGDGPDAVLFDPPPPDLIEHAGHHEDDYILWRISEGVGTGMPGWDDKLTLDERWQVITYVRSVAE